MNPRLRNLIVAGALAVLASCGPAGIERSRVATPPPEALERGLNGNSDADARTALGRWIEKHHHESAPPPVGRWNVRFIDHTLSARTGAGFTSLRPAGEFRIHGLDHRQVADGVGVPMIGYRPNDGSGPYDRWFPPEGIYRAVTAVPERHGQRIDIHFYDRLGIEEARFDGGFRPLAGDFTAPWAALLEETPALRLTAFTSLIFRDSGRSAGLFLMEDYDPDKTPILMIHGLLSTPLMWAELTNELWGDPRIRSQYQIWHYLYPTNAPALYPARLLRGQLDKLRKELDPTGNDPAMRRTVVVAHSMGGLLAKTLVVEPKNAFWNAAFTRPLDELNLSPAERATLEEAWFWQPRKHVDRVIFCAVPFRGSKMADSWIGRIGQSISAPNDEWQDFYRTIERRNPGMLTSEYQSLTRRKLSSVWGLSPNVRSLQILDQLPIRSGVGTHIIVGTRGRNEPLEESSDGVVPYSSASLPSADSVKAVPTGHTNLFVPEAIAEIKRVLLLPPGQ